MAWLYTHLNLVLPIFLMLSVASVGWNIACQRRWYLSASLIFGLATYPLHMIVAVGFGLPVQAVAIPWIMLLVASIFDFVPWLTLLLPNHRWPDSEDGRAMRTSYEPEVPHMDNVVPFSPKNG